MSQKEDISGQYFLPYGWRWVGLGEVLKEPLKNGLNYKKENFGAGTKFVNVSDVFCPAVINNARLDRISITIQDIKNYQLHTGDILIVRSSLKREGVAYPALFIEDTEPIVFCGFLIRIRPDKHKIEPFYLLNYLRSSITREKLIGDSDTVTITNVNQGTLLALNIPLPPLFEQHRISAKIQELMQEIDRARVGCERQLEAAKALPFAYLRDVFESEEAKKWEKKRLGDVCEINPPRPKSFTRSPSAPTTFIPMAAVNEKKAIIDHPQIVLYSKVAKGYTYFEENDVLFAKITPCMQNGKHVIARSLIDRLGFGTTEFHVLRPSNDVLSEWIWYFIRQPYFLQEATAHFTGVVGQQRVSEEFLANYPIPLPPLAEQKHITDQVQELIHGIDRARAACEKQLETIEALPQTILSRAFKGEIL